MASFLSAKFNMSCNPKSYLFIGNPNGNLNPLRKPKWKPNTMRDGNPIGNPNGNLKPLWKPKRKPNTMRNGNRIGNPNGNPNPLWKPKWKHIMETHLET